MDQPVGLAAQVAPVSPTPAATVVLAAAAVLRHPAVAVQAAPTELASLVSLERQRPSPATALAAQVTMVSAAQAAPAAVPLA